MAAKHTIDLAVPNRMANRFFICIRDLAGIEYLSLLRALLKLLQERGFFRHAHITPISVIMISRYCFQPFFVILTNQVADMRDGKSCRC